MGSDTPIKIQRIYWTQEVSDFFALMDFATVREIACFGIMVASGDAFLHELTHKGARVGFVVSRIDSEADGLAIVVCAAAAKPLPGVCVASALDRMFSEIGKHMGARCVRFFTSRQGLVKKLHGRGYNQTWALEKDLTDG